MISALFVLGLMGLFYRSVFIAMLALPTAIFWKETRETFFDFRALHLRWRNSAGLAHPIAGVAVVFGFVAAACTLMVMLVPSIIVDPGFLHLPSVEYYALQHALEPVPGIDYSYFPQGIETIWTLVYACWRAAARRADDFCAVFPDFLDDPLPPCARVRP